jgi:tetratricopeptide (TPR) repeat protein
MAQAIQIGARAPAVAWIQGFQRDLLLYIATPLLIVPLVALARTRLGVEEIALLVAAFGSTGHHLPGLLRAYGDRELFARYRTRFTVAPVFFASLCVLFAWADLEALIVMAVLWGGWHGLAQVYGIGRIYDARLGLFSPRTALLDRWLCIAWFGAGMFFSPGRMLNLLDGLYHCGLPPVPAGALRGFQLAWAAGTAVVSAAFLWNLLWQRAHGERQSPAKLGLMAMSFAFWWYAMIGIRDVVLGIALFEIFHDVQYLSIVWVYNRRRVDSGHGIGPLTRRLFQPRASRIAIYVALVLAYGAVSFAGRVSEGALARTLIAFVLASGFLHFYYDAFIWNLREPATREGLALAGGRSVSWQGLPARLRSALAWGLFALPLALLAAGQLRVPSSDLERSRAVAASLPESDAAQLKLGDALRAAGRDAEALVPYGRALELRPAAAAAYAKLGDLEASLGRDARALEAYREAVRLDPSDARSWLNLGFGQARRGELPEAAAAFERALVFDARDVQALAGLGAVRLRQGDRAGARRYFERALELRPRSAAAHNNLALLEEAEGHPERAAAHLEQALESQPDHEPAQRNLARLRAGPGSASAPPAAGP